MSRPGRDKWLRSPNYFFLSSLQLLLLLLTSRGTNESRTYGGGGGDEPLIRDRAFVFVWPVATDTPLVLNEMLLTDETRWRVITLVSRVWSALTCSMMGSKRG